MARTHPPGLNPVEPSLAGTVLAALRRGHTTLTQAQLGEALGVGRTTVQNWESGRVHMPALRVAEVARLRRTLGLAGVPTEQLIVFDQAITADDILAHLTEPHPEHHPLATVVPTRTLTELLSWPMTGTIPRPLADLAPRLWLPEGYRDTQAAALTSAAQASNGDVSGAMLRRQAHYLLAHHPPSADWLAADTAAHVRAQHDLREWSPDWAVERSRAIVAAQAGNPEPLHRFLTVGLATEQLQTANLNYWAYWVGDVPGLWVTDHDMVTSDPQWAGHRLLPNLLGGVARSPYGDLHAHTLHTLLRARPGLVDTHRHEILSTIDQARSTHDLLPDTTRLLDQITYAHRR